MSSKPHWKKLESENIFSNRYFHLRIDKCEMPDGRVVPKYFVVDFPNWVQTVALTKEGKLVIVDQYRYAADGWYLEFPGGSTHPDRKEDPLLAAKRELKEETGYESEKWEYLGCHDPNPALLNNRCHIYLARDCEKTSEPELDPFEEIDVKLMTPTEFREALLDSKRIHSLMLASLELARPHLKI